MSKSAQPGACGDSHTHTEQENISAN
uniref:Uncharacterized protein n=1 Tax=Anguilla anguilla TaxID=7936 RepID=A0A0E9S4S8_ANGAN